MENLEAKKDQHDNFHAAEVDLNKAFQNFVSNPFKISIWEALEACQHKYEQALSEKESAKN